MSFDKADERIARRFLSDRAGEIPEAGYIRPSAHYFSGVEDFWAASDPSKITFKSIERELIAATWIYPVNFLNDFVTGSFCTPRKEITYELYHFTQYGVLRVDESDTPDVFDAKVLEQHENAISAWLGFQVKFQNPTTIPGLSEEDFKVRRTNGITQVEDIVNQALCEFIPRVVGYAFRQRVTVEVL